MASDSPITDSHVKALVIIERVNSSLSVLGCLFIITSFLISKSFHRPINRLVFYASVGNLLTNIATIVSSSVLDNLNGFVCQGQAFLIQMYVLKCNPSKSQSQGTAIRRHTLMKMQVYGSRRSLDIGYGLQCLSYLLSQV